jgi:hypothetical protein
MVCRERPDEIRAVDLAHRAVFGASYVVGVALPVDGGYTV